jgi:hypothetical protein
MIYPDIDLLSKINSTIIIIDFFNILINYYYPFIDTLFKFYISNYTDNNISIDKILENFISFNSIYFVNHYFNKNINELNYDEFIMKYTKFLIQNKFSEKFVNYVHKFLTHKKFDFYQFDKIYIKLLKYFILFIILHFSTFYSFNNFTIVIVINNYLDKHNEALLLIHKFNVLSKISKYCHSNLSINTNIAIKYTTYFKELDDLWCLFYYDQLLHNNNNNIILFSNDKYKNVKLNKHSYNTIFIINDHKPITYKFNQLDFYNNNIILKKIYYSNNNKYKIYNYPNLNQNNFQQFKNIITKFLVIN